MVHVTWRCKHIRRARGWTWMDEWEATSAGAGRVRATFTVHLQKSVVLQRLGLLLKCWRLGRPVRTSSWNKIITKRCSIIIKNTESVSVTSLYLIKQLFPVTQVRLNILYWTFQIPQFILYVYFVINLASIFALLIFVFCVTAVIHKHK